MERACEIKPAFQQSAAEFFPIPEPVVQDAYSRAEDRLAGGGRNDPATFKWPALLRRLDRINPSTSNNAGSIAAGGERVRRLRPLSRFTP